MPIVKTYVNATTGEVEKVETAYLGRVLKVRSYTARRNCSDTLDYTDYRDVPVTEALVWVGREAPEYDFFPVSETNPLCPVLPRLRFKWIDCSNLFVWRGCPVIRPEVDMIALAVPELVEDLGVWLELVAAEEAAEATKAAAAVAADAARKAKLERDRPVVGKQMVVVSGRKVPKGTVGTVAYVHSNGGVLLKDDACWRDRNAQGRWVDPRHLEARQ